jgi:hypothetical protein
MDATRNFVFITITLSISDQSEFCLSASKLLHKSGKPDIIVIKSAARSGKELHFRERSAHAWPPLPRPASRRERTG